jgi:D-glycero-D-manno-heptose 1,7-bisphosphate phosphatase
MSRTALFLDRDGVINQDDGYVNLRHEFKFIDGIFDLVRHANTLGYLVVVVTNQAGIGRGYFTETSFATLTKWMVAEFQAADAILHKVYHCPYHPTAGLGKYLKDDFSRKPKPGMILQAARELHIDLSSSVMIGNKETDMQAGITAGVGKNLLLAPDQHPVSNMAQYQQISSLKEAFEHLSNRLDPRLSS